MIKWHNLEKHWKIHSLKSNPTNRILSSFFLWNSFNANLLEIYGTIYKVRMKSRTYIHATEPEHVSNCNSWSSSQSSSTMHIYFSFSLRNGPFQWWNRFWQLTSQRIWIKIYCLQMHIKIMERKIPQKQKPDNEKNTKIIDPEKFLVLKLPQRYIQ